MAEQTKNQACGFVNHQDGKTYYFIDKELRESHQGLSDSVDSMREDVGNDITVLSNTVNGLIENGIGEIQGYPVILKEESDFERLTALNTIPGVLYFGLEPLTDDIEYNGGILTCPFTFISGYTEISMVSYKNGLVTI